MRRWFYFGASLLMLTTGLVLVILFIHMYVIPRQQNPEFLDTFCTVVGIYAEDGNDVCDNITDSQQFGCLHVRVSYEAGSSRAYGILHEGTERKQSPLQTSFVTDKTCSCHECQVQCSAENQPQVYFSSVSAAIDVNTSIPCVIHQTQNREHYLTKLQMINIMLWPSLCFVVGFVGTFLSCILLTYDVGSPDCLCTVCQRCFSFI